MAKEGYTIIVVSPKLTRIFSINVYDRVKLRDEVSHLDLLRRQNSSDRAQIQWFAIKIKDLKENMARLNTIERKIRITANLQTPATNNGLSGVGGPQAEEHPLNSLSNNEPEQLEPEIPESESKDRLVEIRNLKTFVGENPIKLNIKFDLYKVDPQHRIAKGWLIMVASADRSGSPLHVSHPRTTLQLGEPIDIRSGSSFAIRRFKKVNGYFERPSMDVRFNRVIIFVYDQEKSLILKEAFPIVDKGSPS
jgi:hypothetical protein